jgi:hypothetical protein
MAGSSKETAAPRRQGKLWAAKEAVGLLFVNKKWGRAGFTATGPE